MKNKFQTAAGVLVLFLSANFSQVLAKLVNSYKNIIGLIRRLIIADDIDKKHKTIRTDGGCVWKSNLASHEVRLQQLNSVTQVTRANLIQNILGHKWMMPSKKEIDYYNKTMSSGNLTGHLKKLEENNVVMRAIIPQGDRVRGNPSVFFTLTDEGYALLAQHSMFFPDIDSIREDHSRAEKTEEIKKCQQAPRPTVNVDYNHPLKGDGISVVDPQKYVDDIDLSLRNIVPTGKQTSLESSEQAKIDKHSC